MTVTFTLTTSSTAAGPFNISGTTSGGVLNGVSIATGISKATLLTGHPISNISETITGGTIASTGTCTTTDTWFVISPTPTPTDTPTPTPTLFGAGGRYNCDGFNGGCVEAVDGDYASLAACQEACPQSPGPA